MHRKETIHCMVHTENFAGCGNAFCGAFLAALLRDGGGEINLRGAAAWGCVAGSVVAEHEGIPPLPSATLAPLARQRWETLYGQVVRLNGAFKV